MYVYVLQQYVPPKEKDMTAVTTFIEEHLSGSNQVEISSGKTNYEIAKRIEKYAINDEDIDKAAFYYRMSAIEGFSPAQLLLARMYQTGHGVPHNDKLADYWLDCVKGKTA